MIRTKIYLAGMPSMMLSALPLDQAKES